MSALPGSQHQWIGLHPIRCINLPPDLSGCIRASDIRRNMFESLLTKIKSGEPCPENEYDPLFYCLVAALGNERPSEI